ncbi:MAG: hypothetical protein EXR62_18165 [Chloroflexi bacterium]|nr:hypothetical protein [Chloroflexota bacterium]
MSDKKVFLEEIHIENFLSLRDVRLPLKPLTVLVGLNASGKSNVLNALMLLGKMMESSDLPSADVIQDVAWAGVAKSVSFQLKIRIDGTPANYTLVLGTGTENRVILEELSIGQDGTKVISVRNGQGEVRDEDNQNATSYRSNNLALKSAGDYGNKPVTSAISKFIRNWEFYDFEPDTIRDSAIVLHIIGRDVSKRSKDVEEIPHLADSGLGLKQILSHWFENDPDRFQAVNEDLLGCTQTGLEQHGKNGDSELYLKEGYANPIPLNKASDGTLRLIAYSVLLNQPELPSLIAIEEPERNLHPAALGYIAQVLEKLAERTQVIITTHSSQLLDKIDSRNLSTNLGVLLLRNIPGEGTEVINFDETRKNRPALDGWIDDFGIGSTIFGSELLQDIMES